MEQLEQSIALFQHIHSMDIEFPFLPIQKRKEEQVPLYIELGIPNELPPKEDPKKEEERVIIIQVF